MRMNSYIGCLQDSHRNKATASEKHWSHSRSTKVELPDVCPEKRILWYDESWISGCIRLESQVRALCKSRFCLSKNICSRARDLESCGEFLIQDDLITLRVNMTMVKLEGSTKNVSGVNVYVNVLSNNITFPLTFTTLGFSLNGMSRDPLWDSICSLPDYMLK